MSRSGDSARAAPQASSRHSHTSSKAPPCLARAATCTFSPVVPQERRFYLKHPSCRCRCRWPGPPAGHAWREHTAQARVAGSPGAGRDRRHGHGPRPAEAVIERARLTPPERQALPAAARVHRSPGLAIAAHPGPGQGRTGGMHAARWRTWTCWKAPGCRPRPGSAAMRGTRPGTGISGARPGAGTGGPGLGWRKQLPAPFSFAAGAEAKPPGPGSGPG